MFLILIFHQWLEPSLDAFFGPARTRGHEGACSVSSAGLEPSPDTILGAANDGDGAGKDAA